MALTNSKHRLPTIFENLENLQLTKITSFVYNSSFEHLGK